MKSIIIGGTHGLGWEIAKRLQALGEETFVVGRTYDQQVHGDGMVIDLSKTDDAQSLAEKITQLPDTKLNFYWVSGYGYKGDFTKQESPESMVTVNFGNVLPAAQAAFKVMLATEESTNFVVISSTTGYKARADEAVYAGTKHAQVGFTRSLGLEAERLNAGIKVTLFMPGGMQTPFWDGDRPEGYDGYLDPVKVAIHVIATVRDQTTTFYEEIIERGSL